MNAREELTKIPSTILIVLALASARAERAEARAGLVCGGFFRSEASRESDIAGSRPSRLRTVLGQNEAYWTGLILAIESPAEYEAKMERDYKWINTSAGPIRYQILARGPGQGDGIPMIYLTGIGRGNEGTLANRRFIEALTAGRPAVLFEEFGQGVTAQRKLAREIWKMPEATQRDLLLKLKELQAFYDSAMAPRGKGRDRMMERARELSKAVVEILQPTSPNAQQAAEWYRELHAATSEAIPKLARLAAGARAGSRVPYRVAALSWGGWAWHRFIVEGLRDNPPISFTALDPGIAIVARMYPAIGISSAISDGSADFARNAAGSADSLMSVFPGYPNGAIASFLSLNPAIIMQDLAVHMTASGTLEWLRVVSDRFGVDPVQAVGAMRVAMALFDTLAPQLLPQFPSGVQAYRLVVSPDGGVVPPLQQRQMVDAIFASDIGQRATVLVASDEPHDLPSVASAKFQAAMINAGNLKPGIYRIGPRGGVQLISRPQFDGIFDEAEKKWEQRNAVLLQMIRGGEAKPAQVQSVLQAH